MTNVNIKFDPSQDLKVLDKMDQMLSNSKGSLNPALELVLKKVEGWHRLAFKKKGARFGGWKKISLWTAILRPKKSGFKKLVTFRDAAAYAKKQNPLISTGQLMQSITGKTKNSVREIKGLTMEFGTNLKYANLHQEGGTSSRVMGSKEWSAFNRAVSKTKETGKKSPRAKKNWNPDYFIMKNVLKRGGSLRVPKRPFLIKDFTSKEVQLMELIIKDFVEKQVLKLGSSA